MYKPFKMKGKSPLMKKLVGKQHNLPEHLKAKIKAAPESPNKKYKSDAESAMKMKPCPGCKTMCAGCKGKKAVPTDAEAIKARKKKYMKTGK